MSKNKVYKNPDSKSSGSRNNTSAKEGDEKMRLRDKILFTLSIIATLLLSLWSVAVRYG